MEQQSGPDDGKDISSESKPSDVVISKTETSISSEGLASNVSPGLEKKMDSPNIEATTSCISRQPGSSASFREGYQGKFLYNYTQYQISAKRPGHPVKSSGPIRSGSEKRTKQTSEWISESLIDAGPKTKHPSPKKPLHKSFGDISQVSGLSLRPVIVEQPRRKTSQRKTAKPVPLVLDSGLTTNAQKRKPFTTTLEKLIEPHMRLLRETLAEMKPFWERIYALVDAYETFASIPWIKLGTAGPRRPQTSLQEQEKVEGFAAVLSSLERVLLRPDLSERLGKACSHAAWPEDADLFENAWSLDNTSYELNSKVNHEVLKILRSISETTSAIQSFVRSSSHEAYSLEILGYLISTRSLEKEFRNLNIAFTSVKCDIEIWMMCKKENVKASQSSKFHDRNIELASGLSNISLLFFNLLIKYQTLNFNFTKALPVRLETIV